MKPFFILVAVFALSLMATKVFSDSYNFKLAGKISISAMLVFTAIGHFKFTDGMAMMIPDKLPAKRELVYFTGILEIIFALLIFFPKISQITGILMIAFFIMVMPANIWASMRHLNYESGNYDGNGSAYLWFRIPFQILLIFWTYYFVVK